MSNKLPADRVTTLDDLERTIAAWESIPTSKYAARAHARVDAWRTAFEWLQTHHGPFGCDDYNDGMALIREKLK